MLLLIVKRRRFNVLCVAQTGEPCMCCHTETQHDVGLCCHSNKWAWLKMKELCIINDITCFMKVHTLEEIHIFIYFFGCVPFLWAGGGDWLFLFRLLCSAPSADRVVLFLWCRGELSYIQTFYEVDINEIDVVFLEQPVYLRSCRLPNRKCIFPGTCRPSGLLPAAAAALARFRADYWLRTSVGIGGNGNLCNLLLLRLFCSEMLSFWVRRDVL